MLNRLDPILLLLFVGILIFSALLLFLARFFPNDGQTFQVISGLLTGFAGAFFTRIKPKPEPGDNPSASVASVTITDSNPEKSQ